MIDHLNIPVTDLTRSIAFYQPVLVTLGLSIVYQDDEVVGFGAATWVVGVVQAGADVTTLHVGLRAPSRATVDSFYRECMSHGGRCNGPPGPRPEYGEFYYAAFVHDPDGHNIEALVRTADSDRSVLIPPSA